MKASNLSRVLSAAMAAVCSLVLLAAVGERMNPARFAASPQVYEFERVVVSATKPARVAAAPSATANN